MEEAEEIYWAYPDEHMTLAEATRNAAVFYEHAASAGLGHLEINVWSVPINGQAPIIHYTLDGELFRLWPGCNPNTIRISSDVDAPLPADIEDTEYESFHELISDVLKHFGNVGFSKPNAGGQHHE